MEFRLIEEHERYQVTYDEGPGSMKYPDIVKSETRVLETWFGNGSDTDEIREESKYLLERRYYPSSDKGDHFYLECRENDSSEWKTVPWRKK